MTSVAVYRHLGGPPLRLRLRASPTLRAHDSGPDGSEPPSVAEALRVWLATG
jgi:hypothetical protein